MSWYPPYCCLLTEQVDVAEMLHDLDLGSTGMNCIHVTSHLHLVFVVSSVSMHVLAEYFQEDFPNPYQFIIYVHCPKSFDTATSASKSH